MNPPPFPEPALPQPHTPVHIRLARPSEADAIAHLHVDVWRATYRDYAPADALRLLDMAKRLPHWQKALSAQTPGSAVWVAEQDGGLLGVVHYAPSHHDAFEGRTEIKHLYVAQHAQGQGLGQRLLTTVLDDPQAAQPGIALAVVEQNTPARQFYARMGGREIATFTDPGPLWKSHNIVLAWGP